MLSRWRFGLATVAGVILATGLTGCGTKNTIGNMPLTVRKIVNTSTLSGQNIGTNILRVTGNGNYIGSGKIPGYYNYGPAYYNGSDAYYVSLEVPINVAGIERRLHYMPHVLGSTTLVGQVYIYLPPLPNEAFDRLYFDPSTRLALFKFKLLPTGQVLDVSWDAVLVNS